ncbi:MAG: hypothetical protein CSB24_03725 [Deltaproteobacteria bacterium]|nr:MAG: hypothetical protein CSB24_03725 [Deltaproteobacteria bacterium]
MATKTVKTDSKGFFSAEIVVEGGPGIKDVEVTATPQGGNSALAATSGKNNPFLGEWKQDTNTTPDIIIAAFYDNNRWTVSNSTWTDTVEGTYSVSGNRANVNVSGNSHGIPSKVYYLINNGRLEEHHYEDNEVYYFNKKG